MRKSPISRPSGRLASSARLCRAGKADAQLIATIGAIAGAVLFAGVFVYILTRSPSKGPEVDREIPRLDGIEDVVSQQQGRATNLELTFVDKQNPTRQAGLFLADKLDPLPGGESQLTSPRAWVYMEDGSFLFLRAPSGFIRQNAGDEIERGRFLSGEGGELLVELMLFDPTPDGLRPEANPVNATLVAKTATLSFDMLINEVIAPGRIEITSERVDFVGRDARVLLDRVLERIDLLEVRGGGLLTVRDLPEDEAAATSANASDAAGAPDAGAPAPSIVAVAPPPGGVTNEANSRANNRVNNGAGAGGARSAVQPSPGSGPGQAPTTIASAGPDSESQDADESASNPERRTRYSIIATDQVVITRGTARINADMLEAWARTINGKLHPEAMGSPDLPTLVDSIWSAWPEAPRADVTPAARGREGFGLNLFARSTLDDLPAMALASPEPRQPVGSPGEADGDAESPDAQAEPRSLAGYDTGPGAGAPVTDEPDSRSVTVAWAGLMTITPQTGPIAPELEGRNHLSARLSSPRRGLVEFVDPSIGASGRASVVEYAASMRKLTLTGVATGRSVLVDFADVGRIETSRLEADLHSGVIVIPAPGLATQMRAPEAGSGSSVTPAVGGSSGAALRTFAWNERASLDMARRGGEAVNVIERIAMRGRVRVVDRENESTRTFEGDSLDAVFTPAIAPGGEPGSWLTNLDIDGEITGDAGAEGSIRAGAMTLRFAPPLEPGGVGEASEILLRRGTLERAGATLSAGVMVAELQSDEAGVSRVHSLDAREAVRLRRAEDGLVATGDRLVSDADAEQFSLESLGETPVRLTRGGSTIYAPQLGWNGETRRAEAFGAGTFEQRRAGAGMDSAPFATASWSERMVFEEESGDLTCEGDASATWKPQPGVTDTLSGARVIVKLSRRESRDASANPLTLESSGARQVARVHAIGQILEEGEGKPAVAQALRESTEPDEDGAFALLQLLRLEAPEFIADNTQQTLLVEHPGRLLLADLRQEADPDPEAPNAADDEDGTEEGATDGEGETGERGTPPAGRAGSLRAGGPTEGIVAIDPTDPGALRGSALFLWEASLLVDQRTGRVTMRRNVRLTHKRLGDGGLTRLWCDTLVAETLPDSDDPARAQLRSATATGSVRVMREGKEMLADRVEYDAETGVLEAFADEGRVVNFFDPTLGVNQTARGFRWNLIHDEVRIFNPGAGAAPRP